MTNLIILSMKERKDAKRVTYILRGGTVNNPPLTEKQKTKQTLSESYAQKDKNPKKKLKNQPQKRKDGLSDDIKEKIGNLFGYALVAMFLYGLGEIGSRFNEDELGFITVLIGAPLFFLYVYYIGNKRP